MTALGWLVLVAGIVAIGAVTALLVRPLRTADLSEQHGKPPRQGRNVVERPAGPGAERMDEEPSPSKEDSSGQTPPG